MKKLGLFLTSIALSFNLGLVSTFAGQNSEIRIAIDNEILETEQEPIIINGRTMVPVRFISEELDYQVQWDNINKSVYIYDEGVIPQTFTGSPNEIEVYLNNKQIIFPDQKPVIIKGTTLIPLKAVADNMDVDVSWDGTQKLVNIYTNDAPTTNNNSNTNTNTTTPTGYTKIEVYGGDLSGTRQPNVVVDIGFGDREYYAYTNAYGQLVKVTADKIILQDDDTEPVYSTGRYYPDEAKVPGTELSDYDEGHVIADSLGGVSNAYNITPQQSVLNRSGDQAYMEKNIRDAGGATNFTAIITYPNTSTQIPSHYSYTYTLNGNIIHDEFDNVNPDKVNAEIIEADKNTNINNQTTTTDANVDVSILSLDKKAEVITIKNNSSVPVDLTGWVIVSVKGDQRFTFPSFTLEPNATVKVGDSKSNTGITFHWLEGKGTWNNSESDPAKLYDSKGNLISVYND